MCSQPSGAIWASKSSLIISPRERSSVNSATEIDGVPEDDSRDGEIEARSPVSLIFEGAVTDFAETVKEHRPGERVARLALVEAGIRSPPQSRIADPVEGEEGAFEPSDLAERFRQRILFGISREPTHQRRRRDGSRLDRRREAQRLVPVFADATKIDGSADHGVQGGVSGAAVGDIQSAIGKIANARREPKPQEVA